MVIDVDYLLRWFTLDFELEFPTPTTNMHNSMLKKLQPYEISYIDNYKLFQWMIDILIWWNHLVCLETFIRVLGGCKNAITWSWMKYSWKYNYYPQIQEK